MRKMEQLLLLLVAPQPRGWFYIYIFREVSVIDHSCMVSIKMNFHWKAWCDAWGVYLNDKSLMFFIVIHITGNKDDYWHLQYQEAVETFLTSLKGFCVCVSVTQYINIQTLENWSLLILPVTKTICSVCNTLCAGVEIFFPFICFPSPFGIMGLLEPITATVGWR